MTAAPSNRARIFKYQAEGYTAYLQGKSVRDCPYKITSIKCRPWIAGYNQARTDRAIKNRENTR